MAPAAAPPALQVPFADLRAQHEALAPQLTSAFQRVVAASAFTLGEEVECFEAEWAAFCGARHCVGVASGTAALTLALRAAGVGPGDEVIVPAHTFIATALAVRHAGARPVFCDVEEATGLIDVAAAQAAVTSRTAAIIPVHLYGQPADMPAVSDLARRHDLLVLEDAAQAHGATLGGRRTGSLGDAAAFSFYPSKNLGALGDGGAICTGDAGLAERARALRNLGQRRRGEHTFAGSNERLDGLQAAFLRAKLPHVSAFNASRRHHAGVLRERLARRVRVLPERSGAECVYHLFPVRVADREALRDTLRAAGIETGVHYAPAVHEQPPFRDPGSPAPDLPVATAWSREELSLPMFAELRPEQVEHVAATCLAEL